MIRKHDQLIAVETNQYQQRLLTELIDIPVFTPKALNSHHKAAPTNPAAPVPEENHPTANLAYSSL